MAKNEDSGSVLDALEDGSVGFAVNRQADEIVAEHLALVTQLRTDYADQPAILAGLDKVERGLNGLRLQQLGEAGLQEKLEELLQVPMGDGKSMHLGAFRKSASKKAVADGEAYQAQVKKLIRNTKTNLTLLLLNNPDDSILDRFMKEVDAIDTSGDPRALKFDMDKLGKSPQLWHYMEVKKGFLGDWLKPFEAELGKPIAAMTQAEFAEALRKVEGLRETKLEQYTNLTQITDRRPWVVFNKSMHTVMNGQNNEFWGTDEVRDEFVQLVGEMITRFTFSLEDRFLIFRTKDASFQYLIGFADDDLATATRTKDGRVALHPHLKVFLNQGDGAYQEIVLEDFQVNASAYYRALKTAVVPFLASMAVMTETTLSDDLKQAFDMWL